MSYVPRLRKKYEEEITSNMQNRFGYTSSMQVPRITKICLNQGIGKATSDKKLIDAAVEELTLITGQKAVATAATKDISNFKLRKGVSIGAKVTLRGDMMYDFLDRLISVALPRTRDFRGVKSNGFDGRGNFSFGVKEQIIFPEIDLDKIKALNGMDITFVTTAGNNEEARALLEEFGFPFTK
ncbi:MAG: ribosomal protein [Bacteroidota bacterium]|jgi:large subunit ribosomal protein L5